MSVKLPSSTQERVKGILEVTGDPTGDGPPEWAFVAECGVEPGDVDYTVGQWATGYDSPTREVTADSPIIGATGATVPLGPGEYQAWIRFAVAGERIVRHLGVVVVRTA